MRTRTAAALLLAAGLLTSCSSNGSNGTTPAATRAATTPTASTASTETDYIHACTKAIIADPDAVMPTACEPLRSDDYFTALEAAQKSHTPTGARTCRDAIKAQYEPGTAVLTGAPTTPPQCAGLSSDQVSQIVLDVIAENTGG